MRLANVERASHCTALQPVANRCNTVSPSFLQNHFSVARRTVLHTACIRLPQLIIRSSFIRRQNIIAHNFATSSILLHFIHPSRSTWQTPNSTTPARRTRSPPPNLILINYIQITFHMKSIVLYHTLLFQGFFVNCHCYNYIHVPWASPDHRSTHSYTYIYVRAIVGFSLLHHERLHHSYPTA